MARRKNNQEIFIPCCLGMAARGYCTCNPEKPAERPKSDAPRAEEKE